MMILQAPIPTLTTTTILPSPREGDSEAHRPSLDIKQSMNGVKYCYVKSNSRSKLQYNLTLSRMKALELEAFIKAYYRAKIRLTNHKGEVWSVNFTVNPFEFSGVSRSSDPGGSSVDVSLEFEGTILTSVSSPNC